MEKEYRVNGGLFKKSTMVTLDLCIKLTLSGIIKYNIRYFIN